MLTQEIRRKKYTLIAGISAAALALMHLG